MTKHNKSGMKKARKSGGGRKTVSKSDKKMMERGSMMKRAAGGGAGMSNIGIGASNNSGGRVQAMKQARQRARMMKRR